jgi:hypothetical protein
MLSLSKHVAWLLRYILRQAQDESALIDYDLTFPFALLTHQIHILYLLRKPDRHFTFASISPGIVWDSG